MGNNKDLLTAGLDLLTQRLPEDWSARFDDAELRAPDIRVDATIVISAPDGRSVRIAVEAKRRFEPRDALVAAGIAARLSGLPLLVVSTFLSPGTRERLLEAEVNWVDLAGNTRLVLSEPGLFVSTEGLKRRPGTTKRPARTLKGVSAGRVVRTLLTSRLPINLSELASRARVDPGYVSRVLELLDTWALLERERRGPVVKVDRGRLVRRWAEEAPLRTRGEIGFYLEPRGLNVFLDSLGQRMARYALTGSFAAQRYAPIASPRLAHLYVADNLSMAAQELELRPAETGANVQLILPRDETIVTTASQADDGLVYVNPVQAVVDLLTSPGRGPAEGEELLRWMLGREDAWFD